MSGFAERLEKVRARIDRAGGERVVLVGVAKTFPVALIEDALAAGLYDIGESYAPELREKAEAVDAGSGVRWHFVGGLQRNKVRQLAGHVSLWQSIDRAPLVDELIKRDPGAAILVQVNSTDEEQKSGCAPAEAEALVDRARAGGLDVQGLMTIGKIDDLGATRSAFEATRGLADALGLHHCSMGMSNDLEVAVEAGSTMVRVGRDLFGARS
ncbi:MAG: YggS family pyridoxal phosphate-dependent enzyme [Acidimicrobiales bacterium]